MTKLNVLNDTLTPYIGSHIRENIDESTLFKFLFTEKKTIGLYVRHGIAVLGYRPTLGNILEGESTLIEQLYVFDFKDLLFKDSTRKGIRIFYHVKERKWEVVLMNKGKRKQSIRSVISPLPVEIPDIYKTYIEVIEDMPLEGSVSSVEHDTPIEMKVGTTLDENRLEKEIEGLNKEEVVKEDNTISSETISSNISQEDTRKESLVSKIISTLKTFFKG